MEVRLWPWHGRWHRMAIAAIVEQGQVLAGVGQDHSVTCGFAINANIREGIRIFKTGEAGWITPSNWPPARPGRVVQLVPGRPRGRSLLDAGREDLEVFLGELLWSRALETVATGSRRLRVLDRWLEEEPIAARRIREP